MAPPLDDDDLLSEILLRLPPQPSSLPRASLVCKQWRSLVSDPGFIRRFRIHHRRNPPFLGFFDIDFLGMYFVSTMDPPNRVPWGRFPLLLAVDDQSEVLGCRHGLVLIFDASRNQLLVWNPLSGEQHRTAIPQGFDKKKTGIIGSVLRAAGGVDHFKVVLVRVCNGAKQLTRAVVTVYSSETGVWSNLVSTLLPPKASTSHNPTMVFWNKPAVLLGNSLYWLLAADSIGILEFDLERQSLAVIGLPEHVNVMKYQLSVMRADDGGLGFVCSSGSTVQLWKRKTECDGVASWRLGRIIDLDQLLSLNSEERVRSIIIKGYAEENKVFFLRTVSDLFTIHLESLQYKKIPRRFLFSYHPFESVYGAGLGI